MPPTLFILFLCVEFWASMLKYKTIWALLYIGFMAFLDWHLVSQFAVEHIIQQATCLYNCHWLGPDLVYVQLRGTPVLSVTACLQGGFMARSAEKNQFVEIKDKGESLAWFILFGSCRKGHVKSGFQ